MQTVVQSQISASQVAAITGVSHWHPDPFCLLPYLCVCTWLNVLTVRLETSDFKIQQ
jgi:hypothetical protein